MATNENTLNAAKSILDIINLINALLPSALRAFALIRAESGMTDEEIIAAATSLNDEDRARLLAIINAGS